MLKPTLAHAVLIAAALSPSIAFAQYSGVDGCKPGPCANVTPCRHCSGRWSGKYGETLTFTTNLASNSVSGTDSVPVAGCANNFVFSISGTITPTGGSYPFTPGTSTLALHATYSSGSCPGVTPVNATLSLQLRNDGCDIAAGSFQNDDGSFSDAAYSMAKPADVPSDESTQGVGWNATWPTVQQFRQTLQRGSGPFDGRQVTEVAGANKADSCFYAGAADNGYAQFGVTGGWWIVGRYATPPYFFLTNEWVDDYVGMTPDLVTFYRNNGRTPCDANAEQLMNICTNGQGCPFKQQYKDGFITYSIDANTVTAGRNNIFQSRPWP